MDEDENEGGGKGTAARTNTPGPTHFLKAQINRGYFSVCPSCHIPCGMTPTPFKC
jgi:hypothetical protein